MSVDKWKVDAEKYKEMRRQEKERVDNICQKILDIFWAEKVTLGEGKLALSFIEDSLDRQIKAAWESERVSL